jgi:molybdopterin converting factor small subunit
VKQGTAGERIQVQVNVWPWFSERLEPGRRGALSLEEELPPGSTLRTLLDGLAGRYAGLQEAVYSPGGGKGEAMPRPDIHAGVVLTHNGRLVALPGGLDRVLQDGDEIGLIPSYPGG